MKDILNIAYSELFQSTEGPEAPIEEGKNVSLAPKNTMKHFQIAGQYDFDGLKADLRITKDGVLVLCHDPGYTLNPAGQITRFDAMNYMPIIDHSFAEIQQLVFENSEGEKVATLEEMVRFCHENQKTAYITARGERIHEIACGMMEVIARYHMENQAIINSFTFDTIKEVRKYTQIVPVSQVQPYGQVLTKETVKNVADLGNSIVTMFTYPRYKAVADRILSDSEPALDYAKELGVFCHMAQVESEETRRKLIKKGFNGFQILYPFREH